jgi:hypothetical protein
MNELDAADARARERASTGHSFIVQAPAGSESHGATQRYLRLLITVEDPNQGAGIFTRGGQ